MFVSLTKFARDRGQSIAESTFFNLVLGIRQDGKELKKGLVGSHREILLHQLSSHFLEGREDKHWILSGVWMMGRALKLTRDHLAVAPCTRRMTQFLYY